MLDISDKLVNIMSEEDCTSVYALFVLSKENDYVSNESKISTDKWDYMGARDRRCESISVNA